MSASLPALGRGVTRPSLPALGRGATGHRPAVSLGASPKSCTAHGPEMTTQRRFVECTVSVPLRMMSVRGVSENTDVLGQQLSRCLVHGFLFILLGSHLSLERTFECA